MDPLIRERLEQGEFREMGAVFQWALDDPTIALASKLEAVDIIHRRIVALAAAGEDLNVQDRLGHTFMHWLAVADFWRGRDVNTLLNHILEFVYMFDINVQNARGQTPLICATIFDRPRAVEFLLRLGADREVFDNNNRDAFYYATENEYWEVVQLLKND